MAFFLAHWPFWGLMLLFLMAKVILAVLSPNVANALAMPILALLTVATSGAVAIYIMRVYRDYQSRKEDRDDESLR